MINQPVNQVPRVAIPLLSLACVIGPAPVAAQGLEEIVVTAQKREVSAQDTPVAVSSFSSEDLRSFNLFDSRDISAKTPNLFMGPSGGGLPLSQQVYIRGQGQNGVNISTDPSIGTYIDGIYVAKDSGSLVELVDIERIEVLRGPQGTLYGRNTTGGAIKMFSVRPDPNAGVTGWIRGTGGDYGRIRTQGAVNIPLSPNFALRYSGAYHNRDGYTETSYLDARQQPARKQDTNDLDSQFHRINALWDASDRMTVFVSLYTVQTEINGHLNRNLAGDIVGPAGFAFFSDDFYEGAANNIDALGRVVAPKSELEGFGGSIEAVWDTPAGFEAQLTLSRRQNEANGLYFDVDGTAWPFLQVHSSTPQDFESTSAELQFKGFAMDERLSWLGGIYTFEEEGYDGTESTFFIAGRSPSVLQAARADGANESLAAFAHFAYDLNESLIVEGGLRWTQDEKSLDGRNRLKPLVSPLELCLYTPGAPNVVNTTGASPGPLLPGTTCTFTPSEEWDYWSWNVGVQYRFTDDFMAYAKSSATQRAGGHQYRDVSGEFDPFDEETLTDVEIGFKSEFADNRARLNVAYFAGSYTDYQNTIQAPTSLGTVTTAVVNFGDADVRGFEADFEAVLTASISLQGGFGTTRVDYEDDNSQQFNIPELTGFLSLSYASSYGFGDGLAQLNWSYRGEMEKEAIRSINLPNSVLPSHATLDLRVGVDFNNGFEVSAWARNLTGEEYYSDALNFNSSFMIGYVGEPQTWGIDIGYRW